MELLFLFFFFLSLYTFFSRSIFILSIMIIVQLVPYMQKRHIQMKMHSDSVYTYNVFLRFYHRSDIDICLHICHQNTQCCIQLTNNTQFYTFCILYIHSGTTTVFGTLSAKLKADTNDSSHNSFELTSYLHESKLYLFFKLMGFQHVHAT